MTSEANYTYMYIKCKENGNQIESTISSPYHQYFDHVLCLPVSQIVQYAMQR